eukprot:CAMPEP_0116922310 /NCGR_PEP_ID=MMETSP0467-20121206/22184_1 /TAXON_ID=283647 /ORGANISM="Mesodinium pulex, Strain SPMC105" /LENGTH=73 /DNA_ID=CAMNT_0004600613 /DNA_START=560 /DNA_END=782 /DNA_ORIENTATION=-
MMEQMQMQMGGGMMGGGGADPKEVLNDQVDMLKDEGGKMDVIKREKYIFEHMKSENENEKEKEKENQEDHLIL